jgi:7-cyano-7-deazaguanine synthase
MSQYSKILLLSGGIDSFVAWHWFNKPQTLYFNLRSRYSEKEMRVVKRLDPSIIIDDSLNLGSREIGDKAYIPFRNLLLAAQAVKYSDVVVIAGLKDDVVSDKNEAIFQDMSTILSKMEGRSIQVISPFWQHTKEQVVKWFLTNGGTEQKILSTVSCYDPDPDVTYCGRCPSCFRKWVALRSNGIDVPFFNTQLMNEYYQKAQQGVYITERNLSIVREIDAYHS